MTKNFILFLFFLCIWVSNVEAEQPKKIALLFLTRSGVNHPHFWKKVLTEQANNYNVYLYADHNLPEPFFEFFRIKELIPTSWGCHIKTWQLLLREAYLNKENVKFVYLSESCIPLMPLEEIHTKLTQDENSYLCYSYPWWDSNSNREIVELPLEHRWANHEWIILNRKHAGMIVNDAEVIDAVSKHWIDSESYPATLFSVKNCLFEFINALTTYVNWTLPEDEGAHPYQFRQLNHFNFEMLMKAKKQGYFFARKFHKSFEDNDLLFIMKTKP